MGFRGTLILAVVLMALLVACSGGEGDSAETGPVATEPPAATPTAIVFAPLATATPYPTFTPVSSMVEVTVVAMEEATAAPKPTEAPTAVPEPTEAPMATPEPTEAPTATLVAPTATPEPTEAPTAVPEPTEAPTAVPEPTEAPTAVPEAPVEDPPAAPVAMEPPIMYLDGLVPVTAQTFLPVPETGYYDIAAWGANPASLPEPVQYVDAGTQSVQWAFVYDPGYAPVDWSTKGQIRWYVLREDASPALLLGQTVVVTGRINVFSQVVRYPDPSGSGWPPGFHRVLLLDVSGEELLGWDFEVR